MKHCLLNSPELPASWGAHTVPTSAINGTGPQAADIPETLATTTLLSSPSQACGPAVPSGTAPNPAPLPKRFDQPTPYFPLAPAQIGPPTAQRTGHLSHWNAHHTNTSPVTIHGGS